MRGECFWGELQASASEKYVGDNSGSFCMLEPPCCLFIAEEDPFLFDCMLALHVIYHLAIVQS